MFGEKLTHGCWWLACCIVLLPLAAFAEDDVNYTRQIQPILQKRCYACHGGLKQESGLRLDTGELLRRGGDSGAVVMPARVDASLLIRRVTSSDKEFRMPPEGEPLSAEQIAWLKAWIARGADSPADEKPEEDARKHWAFQPPTRSLLPALKDGAWPLNPVDSFIAKAQETRALPPLDDAPQHVLLRRVFLDLIGLPPTRDELRAFLADDAPDAYERVVDRLLASPQYGERWARHWMDVWRYSDWYGRRAVPDVMNSYPMIWRWRDWIVRSLNEDRGYDWMIQQMLAADEIAPDDDANVVATGFIVRNWFKWNYNTWMKDQVEHTGKAFLGLTLNCCHCHDHKYDPFTQEEYFKFRAFFEPLELRQDRIPGEPDPGPFKKYVYAQSYGPIKNGLVRVWDEKLDAQTFMYSKGDHRLKIEGQPPIAPGAPAALGGNRLQIEPIELPPTAFYPGLKPFVQQEEIAQRRAGLVVAEAALATVNSEFAKSRESRAAELAQAEQELVAARQVALGAGQVLGGTQSLLLDAAQGRRSLAHRLAALLRLEDDAVVSYKVAIWKDAHTNFQLGLDVDQGATGSYVGFENGKIQTYAPGGFHVIEPGKYDLAAGQNRFAVTLTLDLPNNTCRVTVKCLNDGQTLVDAVPAALNGWRPEPNGKRGIFIDARPGSVALYDDITFGRPGAEPALRFEFEYPTHVEGEEVADHDGWLNTSFSAAPATSKIVSAVSLDERVIAAAKQLQAARRKQDAAQWAVTAAETNVAAAQADLASIVARIAADNSRYGMWPGHSVAETLPGHGVTGPPTDVLIRAAVVAERQANIALAEAKLATAEKSLAAADAASELQKSQQQLTAARAALASAQAVPQPEPTDYTPLTPKYPTRSTGRRAALARWIASAENPLTARVAVNHIWLRHFGRAFVETTFDFGRNGKRPSHPELLDWLANELMDAERGTRSSERVGPDPSFAPHSAIRAPRSSWSTKRLHRLLVTSHTYRLRSNLGGPTHSNLAADPDNRWLWRFSPARMQAETVRDSLLHVAGELDPQFGGHEIDPAQGLASQRRSLYFAHHVEGKMEFLELFDAPNPTDCYQRSASIQPQQALALSNSELTKSVAQLLAERVWKELAPSANHAGLANAADAVQELAFITAVFEKTLSRAATADETAASIIFLRQQALLFRDVAPATAALRARENFVHALLNHNDFVTIR